MSEDDKSANAAANNRQQSSAEDGQASQKQLGDKESVRNGSAKGAAGDSKGGASKQDATDESRELDDSELPCEISEGLTSEEAKKRLAEYGPNELPERRKPSWRIFLEQFLAPTPIMILIAAIVEYAIVAPLVGSILLAVLLLNAVIGWYETQKAGNAVAALKQGLKPEASVKRDGKLQTLVASELVPGDCVLLGSGSAVPADCMVNSGQIDVDQAALTGESLPVKMKKGSKALMGSNVVRGETEATVQFTGANTYFGKTAALLNTDKGMGHLQKMLLGVVIGLTVYTLVLIVICFIYLMVKYGDAKDALNFCVAVVVAAIPLALEIVVTSTLALGSRKLAQEGAIVTRLAAIEDLSGMNILCSDKTGTLTLNKMVVQDDTPTFVDGLDQAKVLVLAALAAKWREPPRDALDTLVLGSANLEECDRYEQLDFTPFDPATKFTAGKLKGPDGHVFQVIKGAPQVILKKCKDADKAAVESAVTQFAERGIRTLGVARTNGDDDDFKFAALITFLDPPRPDTEETIHRAFALGVDVKMITGDQVLVARETARTLSMGDNVLEPTGLPDFEIGQPVPKDLGEKYGQMCFEADGFAQVYPEHKFLIVECLRQMGFGVGMTGDGVNDAPALKQADAGIAVAGATDAARAAADIVFSEEGLSTIITGIEVARQIFQRMQNFLIYRSASTFQLAGFFFIALFAFDPKDYAPANPAGDPWPDYWFLPALLLVFITVLNDGTMIAIGYDNAKASDTPAKWNLKALFFISTLMACVITAASLFLLWCMLDSAGGSGTVFNAFGLPAMEFGKIVMASYLQLTISGFLTLFSARTGPRPFFATMPSLVLSIGALASLIISTIIACAWAPGSLDGYPIWGLANGGNYHIWAVWVWLYSIVVFLIQDGIKMAAFWLMIKLDLFNYKSGMMVATRDDHKFDATEATSLAAGRLESKALEASLKSTSTAAARLSAQSTQGSLAHSSLQRLSSSADLARSSLAQLSAASAGAGMGRVSQLPTIDERRQALQQLSSAGASVDAGDVPEGMERHMARVSNASERLRRVSAAMDMQRKSARGQQQGGGGKAQAGMSGHNDINESGQSADKKDSV